MQIKNILLIGLILLMVIPSCKKDDTYSATNSNLIGTWAENASIEQFTFTFKSNGQGAFQIKNCTTNKIEKTESFMYVFDSKTNEILFSQFSEGSIGYVRFITESSIRLYNNATFTDDWSEEMYKQ